MTKAKNEGQTWTHEQWEAYIPGYNSQFEADYENGDYLPSEGRCKLVRRVGGEFVELRRERRPLKLIVM